VLVTGATGFTGGHLCERLVGDGHRVRALVRDAGRASRLRELGVELAVGDLCQPHSLERATEGVDLVYHIGALFRPENVTRRQLTETNVDGTRHLLDAALRSGVRRFVHCSTVGVHGDIRHPPANEDTPFAPGDPYQESKTEGERVVHRYMADGRLPIVVFRPGGIYGPGDMRFLKLFRAIKTRRFVMLGSGSVQYQLVYIDDLVDGILLCGQHAAAPGNVYILTGEAPVTLRHLVGVIAKVLGVEPPRLRFPVGPVYVAAFCCELVFKPLGLNPPLYRRRVDFFRKTRAFDISRAKRSLGFNPSTALERGVASTAEWYRASGHL
jgi:nucleoside-diphosphate-sugar epimerase